MQVRIRECLGTLPSRGNVFASLLEHVVNFSDMRIRKDRPFVEEMNRSSAIQRTERELIFS